MSIFDKKKEIYDVGELLKDYTSFIIKNENTTESVNPWKSILQIIQSYILNVLKQPNIGLFIQNLNEQEFFELAYNSFLYEYDRIRNIDKIFYQENLNYQNLILKNGGFEFIKIDQNKYKLIDTKEKLVVSQIENEQWQDQLYKFFTNKEIVEKEKILGWFSGHIEEEIKKFAKNNQYLKYKEVIHPFFGRMNNLYKHFDKTKANLKNKDQYNKYQNLSENEKLEQLKYDIYLTIFLIINYQNKKDNIKNHI